MLTHIPIYTYILHSSRKHTPLDFNYHVSLYSCFFLWLNFTRMAEENNAIDVERF